MFRNKQVFLLLFITITSVRGWFTCDQLDFCKNIRNNKNGSSPFIIDESSAIIGDSTYEADVVNKNDDNIRLKLTLTSLEDNTFRLTINDPKKPRHTVREALDGEPKQLKFDDVKVGDGYVFFYVGSNYVQLHLNPFDIQVYRDLKSVMVINPNNDMVFNSGNDEAIALDVSMSGSRAYGIPEHAERLSLKTTRPGGLDPYRLYNVDYPGYAIESRESLYGSVPVLYAHGMQKSSGVFWLNSAQTFVEINTENGVHAYFISETGAIDLFFFTGPTLEESVKQYAKLTGTAPLPQLFALGFHQSRWSYESQEDVLNVVSGFDKYNFPLDVMWLDIDYTDNIKYFTWNPVNFSNPLQMQERLTATGRKLVVIIDPHYKVEPGYFVYDEGLAKGYFVKYTNGSVYQGSCWPGLSTYMDYLNPEVRKWYSSLYSLEKFPNTTLNTYIWNDMNEPSVFDAVEKTMPFDDVQFYGGWLHKDVHNIFGFYQTMGTYEGLLARSNHTLRPFILTRAHFAGSQRYTAMWTGDNVANWENLRINAPMCLTEALAGISFNGADIGGFNNDVEDELFQRWYQLGAWLPFFRSHATKGTKRREPYLYPEEIQKVLRNALQQRYVHLPYWYTVWWQHTTTGVPVVRPLTYQYLDPYVFDIDHEWLVGSDILVSPVMEKGATSTQIYLPGVETWFNIEQNTWHNGGQNITIPVDIATVPVFYRGGSIIPRKDTIRSSTVHTHEDDYSLYVILNSDEKATGNLYIDDFESFDYKNKEYLYVKYEYKNSILEWSKIDTDADYSGAAKIGNIYVHGQSNIKRNVTLLTNGKTRTLDAFYNQKNKCLTISGLQIDVSKPFQLKFH